MMSIVPGYLADEVGDGRVDVFALPTDTTTLLGIVQLLFGEHWQRITFGVRVPGVVWDMTAPRAPYAVELVDDEIVVSFGPWDLRLGVGSDGCARVELFRMIRDDRPTRWGLRLFTSTGSQMLSVTLPHPWLDVFRQPLLDPEWSHLTAWNELRARFLALEPDPLDRTCLRSGAGFPELTDIDDTDDVGRDHSTFTALVCRGCCCGQAERAPGAAEQIDAIRDAVAHVDGARLRVTNCLGPCSEANIVVVRHRDPAQPGQRLGATWLSRLTDTTSTLALTQWLRDGARAVDLPATLLDHVLDLDSVAVLSDSEITVACATLVG